MRPTYINLWMGNTQYLLINVSKTNYIISIQAKNAIGEINHTRTTLNAEMPSAA